LTISRTFLSTFVSITSQNLLDDFRKCSNTENSKIQYIYNFIELARIKLKKAGNVSNITFLSKLFPIKEITQVKKANES
jgi:ATP-dependent phosphoenolpyruvate carboxykinase